MNPRLAIVGAGGHGREILDIVRSADPDGRRWSLVGIVADTVPDASSLEALDVLWLGTVDEAIRGARFDIALVAVGEWRSRQTVATRLGRAGLGSPSVVHARAYVGSDSRLGDGCAVWPGAVVSTHVRLGRHSHVNQSASISHDVTLDDFVTVAPHATLCGSVRVGTGAWVGAGACVLEGRTLGEGSVVGAGAVVTRDVAPWTVVSGVPARVTRVLDVARGQP